ncbi:baseplate J/gp47 family protein [Bacillus badius]|uniref:Phage-like element PBSX protein xkdT n=1 Tax=Bacillus badius TaxID=1455 RepID=A0ABR5B163_BACBA|nr:baseplate J/gp47 family protein [Bacillus badius]KIL80740.1 Phage-like element PBSX protein xkdT [Bacillus badius]MED4715331.1 baseplate J/gp47 family protein [Bacillus badius]
MFEQYTSEYLLQEMINDTKPEFDVSETSPLYASYAASANQVAKAYRYLERVLELVFASTSEGDYLEKRTSEMDVFYRDAVAAIRRGEFNISVPVGSRFFVEDVYFIVSENENGIQLLCEQEGEIGNTFPVGTELLPVETIEGLETALLGEIIIPGREKEEEASLFVRYQDKVAEPATSGNIGHYKEWVREFEGVGAVRVFPNWDGPDTVKVVIVDSNFMPAAPELVQSIQMALDPDPGQGEGLAPIGAFVTVESAPAYTVNVSATVEINSSTTIEEVKVKFERLLAEHLKTISFKEDVDPIVRERVVGSLLFGIPGVIDYSNLLINGQEANIILSASEVPVVGQVTLSV